MKKRVLRINRMQEEVKLPEVIRTSAYQTWDNDFFLGYEWLRVPGSSDIPGLYKAQEYLGNSITTPSYLHQYNKNDFIHECYHGEVWLKGESKTIALQVHDRFQQARNKYGLGGLRIFYPFVLRTGEQFKLYLGSPGIGVPSVWKHPSKTMFAFVAVYPQPDGSVRYYINRSSTERTAKQMYQQMLDGYAPYKVAPQTIFDEIIKTSNIPDFTPPPLYGSDYFELYMNLGLRGALANAASTADGFHFSRLAGEIACDGLVINTIATLFQQSSKWLRKAGPLGSKLKTCFKLLPQVYLAYQYGIAAPLREYASLPMALQNQFNDIGPLVGQHETRFRDFNISSRISLNLGPQVDPNDALNLVYLTKGGLSLDDLWELIPLSFVVDWFLNISKFLEAGRASQIYSVLPVKSATFSTSFERDVPLPDNIEGSISHRCYIRKYLQGSSLPADVFDFSISDFRGTLSLRNVDEGIALFLSYII